MVFATDGKHQGTFTEEWFEFNFLRFVEDRFGCSGFCHLNLFYFSKNIEEGPGPQKMCLYEIHDYLKEKAGGFGTMCNIIAFVSLICFFEHFFIYGKDESKGPASNIEMPSAASYGQAIAKSFDVSISELPDRQQEVIKTEGPEDNEENLDVDKSDNINKFNQE